MKISFESKGGFNNITSWLNKVSKNSPDRALRNIANDGEQSLGSHTPRDTGETASGWKAEIDPTRNGSEISWVNNAHPESRANVAKLIELGHGTRTGGYVPPNPYIKRSMDPVWKTAGDRIVKELIE